MLDGDWRLDERGHEGPGDHAQRGERPRPDEDAHVISAQRYRLFLVKLAPSISE
jgi:hypothetical protein